MMVDDKKKHFSQSWLNEVKWNEQGLVCTVAQDQKSRRVLMVAWMNREALELTQQTGYAHYFSRSRRKLWKKGESSGHVQKVIEMYLDCDGDALLLEIEQVEGIACHTGRESCFYRRFDSGLWEIVDEIIKPEEEIYQLEITR